MTSVVALDCVTSFLRLKDARYLCKRMRYSQTIDVISKRISDDIPPQMKILNMAIPILMHYCS